MADERQDFGAAVEAGPPQRLARGDRIGQRQQRMARQQSLYRSRMTAAEQRPIDVGQRAAGHGDGERR
jgi:hypothetical protein